MAVKRAPLPGTAEPLTNALTDFEHSMRRLQAALASGDAAAVVAVSGEIEQQARTLSTRVRGRAAAADDKPAVRRIVRGLQAELRETRQLVQQAQASAHRGLTAFFPQAAQSPAYAAGPGLASPTGALGSRRLGSA